MLYNSFNEVIEKLAAHTDLTGKTIGIYFEPMVTGKIISDVTDCILMSNRNSYVASPKRTDLVKEIGAENIERALRLDIEISRLTKRTGWLLYWNTDDLENKSLHDITIVYEHDHVPDTFWKRVEIMIDGVEI